MFHLNDLLTGPPRGWRYEQPQSGMPFVAITFESLLGKIAQHRANMQYPPISEGYQTLAAEIEDWICQHMSPRNQTRKCSGGARSRPSVGWQEVESFMNVNKKFFEDGKQLVPQAEAERRSGICANCPLNVGVSGCSVCRRAVDAYRALFLNRGTSKDRQIRACGVCGCDLKTIVHMPLGALKQGGPHEFPKWCWQND